MIARCESWSVFPMNDPDLVRSGESRTDLDHNREYARDGQCMRIPFLDSEHLRQRRTIDQLHRQELFAQVFSDVVHLRVDQEKLNPCADLRSRKNQGLCTILFSSTRASTACAVHKRCTARDTIARGTFFAWVTSSARRETGASSAFTFAGWM